MGDRRATRLAALTVVGLIVASCGDDDANIDASFGSDRPAATSATPPPTDDTPAPPAELATTTTPETAPPSTTGTTPVTTVVVPATTTASTTSTTTTSTTTTTLPGPPPVDSIPPSLAPPPAPADPSFGATGRAFDQLAARNLGASMTVSRDGHVVFSRASGSTIAGDPATPDTPMVVASVSKLVLGVAVARLEQLGLLDDDETVPWGEIGLLPHPAWSDVTVRELLEHAAGMPVARWSWFEGGTDCRTHVQGLVAGAPQAHRGRWTYSNGNFCVLGLVVEARSELRLDEALQHLVFDPVGVDGAHLTDDGMRPDDMPHPHGAGVARLSRLGAAGNLVVSTDDLAVAMGRLTPADRAVVVPEMLFRDQYGIGHTGTIDGAKACVWLLEGGRSVVAATVAGDSPSTGGGVCDLVVPAVSVDLGLGGGTRPDRDP